MNIQYAIKIEKEYPVADFHTIYNAADCQMLQYTIYYCKYIYIETVIYRYIYIDS